MAINFMLPLRIIQAVFAIIVLGLISFVVNEDPFVYSAADFMLFNSIWTLLVVAYLVLTPMFMPNLHNRWVVLALEFTTMVFWFAGFIALAVSIQGSECNDDEFDCSWPSSVKAAAAFGAFEWVAWAATLGLVAHAIYQYRKGAEQEIEPGTTPETGGTSGLPTGEASLGSKTDIEKNGGGQFDSGMKSEIPQLPPPLHVGEDEVGHQPHDEIFTHDNGNWTQK